MKEIFGQESFHSSFGGELETFEETFLIAIQIRTACVRVVRLDRILSFHLIVERRLLVAADNCLLSTAVDRVDPSQTLISLLGYALFHAELKEGILE